MDKSAEQLKQSRAFLCLECGKCTAVCPISRYNRSYSPRRLLAEGLFYDSESLLDNKLLWSCLTCQLCSQRCPVDVHYSEYMRDVRATAYRSHKTGNPSHGGTFQMLMEMAAQPGLKQNRMGWLNGDLKVKKSGEVLYFVGCLPYYEDYFAKELEFSPISIAKDTVRILNRLGIEPVVLENERCCGHDLYWLGQLEQFDQIGRLNLDQIKEVGAKTVVTACPECALCLKELYAERLGGVDFEVKHISQLVAENVDRLHFKEQVGPVSYHDPCRLGRYLDVYEQPRQALEAIPGLELNEMPRNRKGAVCCGTTNWMNCDSTSKQIQQNRLKEAKATGAATLVTACPKCLIHLRCAGCGESEKVDIRLTDFVNVIASALKD